MLDQRAAEDVEARVWASICGLAASEQILDSKGVFAATALFGDADHPLISRVLGLGSGRAVEDEMLGRIVALYDAAGADSIFVPLSPMARPARLPRMLKEHGFEPAMKEAKLYRPTENPPTPEPYFQIREAKAEELEAVQVLYEGAGMSKAWTNVVAAQVGAPCWHHYLALDGGKPVALGSMYAWEDYAYSLPGWTLPAFRRRGYQRALGIHRIGAAGRLGCKWVTANVDVTDSPIGFTIRSYERLGFKLLYLRDTYVRRRPEVPPQDRYSRRMMAPLG
jgi:GNAT superfamily N-acetyltransferase